MHQLSNTPKGVSLEGVKPFLLNTKINQNIFLAALLLDGILKFFLAVKMLDSILYIRCLYIYIYISKVNLKNNRYKRNKRPCWTAPCISDIIYIRTFRMLDSICCTEPWKTMFSKVLLSLLLNKQAQSFRISKHA